MKFYLDTASLTEIQEVVSLGLLDGVAMNAYSSTEQGMNFYQRLREICRHVNGPISVGMLSIEEKAMIKEGKELFKIHENVIVKCPLTPAGLKATKRLTTEGIKVNVSLCFSLAQALIAAKAGAWCVSLCPDNLDHPQYIETNRPYHLLSRYKSDDPSFGDGITLTRQIIRLFQSCGYPTQILLTGIRSPEHVRNAALGGAHICMMPFPVISNLCDPSVSSSSRPIPVGQEHCL
ncbi:MAG: transaldolase family protein [Nitrospirales bacterium]|nr:fructose-6-phosphate aldolase [Nitrospirales bacterium]